MKSYLAPLVLLFALGCGGDDEPVTSSHAYKGHANDVDVNNFVNAYHDTVGTRLDDCQTCHKGGTFTSGSGEDLKTYTKNACDFCHLIDYPASNYNEVQPAGFGDTLNPYGAAYLAAGRTQAALGDIASDDSDDDGFANRDEIEVFKYPGDPASKPGQPTAPMKILSLAELQALTPFTEFLLANANKQQFDSYANYKGVKIKELLEAAGVDLSDPTIEGITVIAPDGYLKDMSLVDITEPFPAGLFYGGLDTATLGTECGFVTYPDELPSGLTDGGEIPGEQWLLLAYERDGMAIDPAELDPVTGSIEGEGPLRVIVPQATPDKPDRGSQYSPTECGDGNDYDVDKDHNAGAMVRGVIGIRVNPLPAGYEDFDYLNGGWAYIDTQSVIIYGTGITE